MFDGASGAVAFQQISTRRFCARPFGVSFEATGCVSPRPLAIDGDFCILQILRLRDVCCRIVGLCLGRLSAGVSATVSECGRGGQTFAWLSTVGIRAFSRLSKPGK